MVLGRVAQTGRCTLAARGLEYLPAGLRPARRAVAPDVQAMLGRLTEDAQSLIRCRPVIVTLAGRLAGELLLGGGSEAGLRVVDLLPVGGPKATATENLDWPLAEVASVSTERAPARPLNGGHVIPGHDVAVRLP